MMPLECGTLKRRLALCCRRFLSWEWAGIAMWRCFVDKEAEFW
jgi:hypothetical protein